MTLEQYAKQNRGRQPDQQQPERQQHTASTASIRQAALQVIKEYKINKEIAEGCKQQILQDINKSNHFVLLMYAAEAIGRLTGAGDSYYLQVKEKIIAEHGESILKD